MTGDLTITSNPKLVTTGARGAGLHCVTLGAHSSVFERPLQPGWALQARFRCRGKSVSMEIRGYLSCQRCCGATRQPVRSLPMCVCDGSPSQAQMSLHVLLRTVTVMGNYYLRTLWTPRANRLLTLQNLRLEVSDKMIALWSCSRACLPVCSRCASACSIVVLAAPRQNFLPTCNVSGLASVRVVASTLILRNIALPDLTWLSHLTVPSVTVEVSECPFAFCVSCAH